MDLPTCGITIESCPDVCERAKWYRDPVMSEIHGEDRGQYNCPYHFGVDHQAATIDGKVMCKHLKRRKA